MMKVDTETRLFHIWENDEKKAIISVSVPREDFKLINNIQVSLVAKKDWDRD